MKNELLKLLESAGIKVKEEKVKEIIQNLQNEEVTDLSDLRYFDKNDLSSLFGFKKLNTAKLQEAIKKLNRKSIQVKLPEFPKEISNVELTVTGKTKLNVENVINFIEMSMLSGLGAEKIGKKILELLEQRMNELEEPASNEIVNVYKLVAKLDVPEQLAALDFNLSLLPKRHKVIDNIKTEVVPSIVGFINDALDFRLVMSDFNSIILAKNLRSKKVEDVSIDNLILASEELAVKTNKVFAGLNLKITEETLKLYKEVFSIIEDKKLQEFLGAKDTRDLLKKIGLDYNPKVVKSFNLLKELVYQMLIVLQDDEIITNPEMLYAYCQNVWNKSKLIDWVELFQVTQPLKTPERVKSNKEVKMTNDETDMEYKAELLEESCRW